MGMTIAEKIIAAAAGVDSVKPGDIHTVKLDRLMSNDGTTHLTVCLLYTSQIKDQSDEKKQLYKDISSYFNEIRTLNSTRYIYTAKKMKKENSFMW